ncbi:MAG: hypothetical protein JSW04_00295 [Desulfobacterales bacterium]|nr:MAG: hypothetical protein JSW04_00295 [Desulfobacterales bacterium]
MNSGKTLIHEHNWPKLSRFPIPAKILVTAIILILSIAMIGALGQIIVHDIIPTFFENKYSTSREEQKMSKEDVTKEAPKGRGDLFSQLPIEKKHPPKQPFYKTEQFVWLLKWSHIHLFGMNMIFIFLGAITIFLDMSARIRTWLVILPFVGVVVDITAIWLKAYVSPVFFWLHLPGGGIFGGVFIIVSLRAFYEMWR